MPTSSLPARPGPHPSPSVHRSCLPGWPNTWPSQVILHATGQTWDTASPSLRQLVQQAIDDTIGAGGDWSSFVARLQADATLVGLIAAAEASGEYLPPPPADAAKKRKK